MTNISETYRQHTLRFPEKIAIHMRDTKVTYKEWYEAVVRVANWLDSLASENKTIAFILPNGIPFLQVFMGASMAGWTAVPLDLKWSRTELKERLDMANPSLVITSRERYDHVDNLHPSAFSWDECVHTINHMSVRRDAGAEGNPPFYMGFTSGTVGDPKAFVRSHDSWVSSFACSRYDFEIDETDYVLITGSLIHSHFLFGAVSTLYLGGTVHIMEKFSPVRTLDLIQSGPISAVYVVPTMIEAMLNEGQFIEKQVKMISSGAKWLKNSKEKIIEWFPNLQRVEFYGASELSFVSVLPDADNERKPGSVGRPCHGVEVEIRRADQTVAKPLETGKIYVRSRLIFNGYIIKDGQGIENIKDADGWATVHDMGYVDEEGYLYITGREKNMILYGGINIFPEEIEQVIARHPEVEEAAVVGLPDQYWGEIAVAVIKGKAEKNALKRWCRQHLASYKIPRQWLFTDEMTYTTSGKIARAELYKQIKSQANDDE